MFEFGQSSGATTETKPDSPKCGLMPAEFKESIKEAAGAVSTLPEKANVASMIDKVTIGAYNKLNTMLFESEELLTKEQVEQKVKEGKMTREEADAYIASGKCEEAAEELANDKKWEERKQKVVEFATDVAEGCKKVMDEIQSDMEFIQEQLDVVKQGITDVYRENICSTMAFPQCVGCPHCTAKGDPFGLGALSAELRMACNAASLGQTDLVMALLDCPGLSGAIQAIASGQGLDMLKRAGINALLGNLLNTAAGQGLANVFKTVTNMVPRSMLYKAANLVGLIMKNSEEMSFRVYMPGVVEWSGNGMNSFICCQPCASTGLAIEKVQDEDGNDVEHGVEPKFDVSLTPEEYKLKLLNGRSEDDLTPEERLELEAKLKEYTDEWTRVNDPQNYHPKGDDSDRSDESVPETIIVPEGSGATRPVSESIITIVPEESPFAGDNKPVPLSAAEREGLKVLEEIELSTKKEEALASSGDAVLSSMKAQMGKLPAASLIGGKAVSGIDCSIIGNFKSIPASVIAKMPGCTTPLATLKAAYGTYCLRKGIKPPRDVSYERFVSLEEPLWA